MPLALPTPSLLNPYMPSPPRPVRLGAEASRGLRMCARIQCIVVAILTANSNEMLNSDKENQGIDLDLPKKRTKVTKVTKVVSAVPSYSTHTATAGPSRKVNPSQVLSPKSHNSRTLPSSPLKAPSPGKSYLARPVSPAKPAAPQMTMAHANASSIMPPPEKSLRGAKSQRTTSKTTVTGSVRGRNAVATDAALPPLPPPKPRSRARAPSSGSTSSGTSAGTTIMKKPAPAKTRTGLMSKVTGLASAAGRKAAGPSKKDPAQPAKRVLRSRKAA
jgi:hypothetical protein